MIRRTIDNPNPCPPDGGADGLLVDDVQDEGGSLAPGRADFFGGGGDFDGGAGDESDVSADFG